MATRTEWTGTASDLLGALAGALKSYRDGLAVLLPGVRLPLPEDEVGEQRSTSETLMHDSLSPAGLIVTCYLTKIPANSRRSTVNSCAGGPSGPAANADITTPYAGVRTR